MVDYDRRFAKELRRAGDAHRPVRPDENLESIFVWKETRCVSVQLTIQYDKCLYLLEDIPAHRGLVGTYIDVYHYPDGRIEPRANGSALPHRIYDKLSDVDEAAIVDNKRLGHILQVVQAVQAKRDNRRSQSVPSTDGVRRKRGRPPGTKAQRALDENDVLEAMVRMRDIAGRKADISK